MLSPEDKKDVKGAYGKAIANKISKVTNDYGGAKHNREAQKRRDADPVGFANREKRMRAENDYKSGNYVSLKPTASKMGVGMKRHSGFSQTVAFSPYRPNKEMPGHLKARPEKFTKI